ADGVYEVCEIVGGRLADETRHFNRLERSLDELRIAAPMSRAALGFVLREVVSRNRINDGLVYVQVTRGVAPRDHVFPPASVRPVVVVTARSIDRRKNAERAEHGISVITVPENRWERVDIKSVSLLPNVLARQAAKEAGAQEAWFVDAEGFVTEGAATNAWIVTADGVLVTRSADHGILRGITREGVFDMAARQGVRIEERRFTPDEAKAAREVFVTSATNLVMPVVRVDDAIIGNGVPGSIAAELRRLFHENVEIAALRRTTPAT
ncbi:MAG: D-amino-acid transaminase, partial [Hyphomicrobiales bacterium]|nr:D-amino-acid transaminase [Hyphomicrobiales bacterium]